MANGQTPIVSVIVPARNEEASLALCLESLVSQTGIDFEVIVVDDDSTDRTAEIARSFATDCRDTAIHTHAPDSGTTEKGTSYTRAELNPTPDNNGAAASRAPEGEQSTSRNCLAVTVIPAPPLPENWTGKNNAMSAGVKIAKGKWLLFTDADTVHKPGSLARAVAEAEQHGAALLSYSPEQEVHTFWEKAVMPVIFAELAAAYPPKKVNDPASPIAAANGQYLMISRAAYDAVGGHTKIAADLLEDVAMARLVKLSGRQIFFRYGNDAVRTRMYRSWEQMREGWTKNLALLFPTPGRTAAMHLAMFYLLLAMPVWAILGLVGIVPRYYSGLPWPQLLAVLDPLTAFVVIAGIIFSKIRRAHFATNRVLAIVGLPLFAYFLLKSKYALYRRRLDWKHRTYVYSVAEIESLKKQQVAIDTEQLYNPWTRVLRRRGVKGKAIL